MVEIVSSMMVDLKISVANFNAKVNSAMVEMKRMKEQVSDIGGAFAKMGALGTGVFTAILASSPALAASLAELKLLWLDISMVLGEELRPSVDWVIGVMKDLWNTVKENETLKDLVVLLIKVSFWLLAVGTAAKIAAVAFGGLELAFAALTSPVGIAVLGIIALTFLFVKLVEEVSSAKDEMEKLDETEWTFSNAFNALSLLKQTVEITMDAIYDLFTWNTDALANDFKRFTLLIVSYYLDLSIKLAEINAEVTEALGLNFASERMRENIAYWQDRLDEIIEVRKMLAEERDNIVTAREGGLISEIIAPEQISQTEGGFTSTSTTNAPVTNEFNFYGFTESQLTAIVEEAAQGAYEREIRTS